MRVTAHEDATKIPQSVWATVPEDEAQTIRRQCDQFFARRARLYLAEIDGALAGTIWAINGSSVPKWYVPLQPDDVILFAAGTRHVFRGRGLHRVIMRRAAAAEALRTSTIYADFASWNTVALRNGLKVGFQEFARRPQGLFTHRYDDPSRG